MYSSDCRRGVEGIAVFLVEGEGEIADCLLSDVAEEERLEDDGGGSAGSELVGEPCAVEGVGGRCGASAVNEERSICKKKVQFVC